MLSALNGVLGDGSVLRTFADFEFARVALASTLVVSAICGLLSPMIVMKQRSYIGDTLAHLVFPGVIGGYFTAAALGLPLWASLLVGAAITGFFGNITVTMLQRVLRIPPDAAAVVTLTGFFGVGVVTVSRLKGTRIDLDRILFGDVLTLTWGDVAVLGSVLAVVLGMLSGLRRHWDAWLSDPEFAEIAGFRVRLIELAFPVLVTFAVLTGMFAVGGLMISALLALPAVLFRPRSVLSWPALGASLVLGLTGLLVAFQFDWPVGSTIVVAGFVIVLTKAVALRTVLR